ncbi:MAG: NAD(P)H-hydrate dehydratase [Desulfuromonadaceae bacterium]|nr:NAD(P)H-hydrate dehydratase [Desulfuromonadaceae bacterium]MDD5105364.1 NAD(P)H-hydrate dehydratase [Desulfuromonadaceae bacterium]
MRVITAQTMQAIDREAINSHDISGLQLMETAGLRCVELIVAEFGVTGHCVVVAGRGNNGGDGFVIARLLGAQGWNVKVIILAERQQVSGDAESNLEKLSASTVSYCTDEDQLAALLKENMVRADVIVDALFGTGLNNDITGLYREAVFLIRESGRPIVSVDIPSGIHGTTGQVMGEAVAANITVTFAAAKLGHILYPGAEYTGRLVVSDIGIPCSLLEAAPGCDVVDSAAIGSLIHRRDRMAHKGHFGHCLIIAGSTGKTGAAALSAQSAVRAGSGLVTVAAAESIHGILEVKTTEAMTVPLPDCAVGYLSGAALSSIVRVLTGMDSVAVGPGLGGHSETYALIRTLVETISSPLVIDADGLNGVAGDVSVLLRKKSKQTVLTPHPGEMSRLIGVTIADIEADRITVARDFAHKYSVFLVLKGARTVIASPSGAVAINSSGNPGMASGGMGDVLTGIIASLLGQGYDAWDACRLGVFLHGYAADLVAEDKGEIGISATDVSEKIPYAYKRLITMKGECPC